jgi:hypothetical protein
MSLPLFILTGKLYENNKTNKLVLVPVSKQELTEKKDIKSPRLISTQHKSNNKSMDNLIKYQLGWSV